MAHWNNVDTPTKVLLEIENQPESPNHFDTTVGILHRKSDTQKQAKREMAHWNNVETPKQVLLEIEKQTKSPNHIDTTVGMLHRKSDTRKQAKREIQ